MVIDVISETLANGLEAIAISAPVFAELLRLRDFLFQNVYSREERLVEKEQIRAVLLAIHAHVGRNPDAFINPYPAEDGVAVRTIDFIAGMTDNYAMNLYEKIKEEQQKQGTQICVPYRHMK